MSVVSIYGGPIWEVQLLQGQLEELGIKSFIPDENTKIVDPFVTGAGALTTQLLVATEDEQAAREAIVSIKGEPPAPTPLTDEEQLERLATRTRWAAVLLFTCPLAIVLGWMYLVRAKKLGQRAPQHGLTVGAMLFGVVSVIGWIVALNVLSGNEAVPYY